MNRIAGSLVKRAFDILASAIGLVALSWLIALLLIVVRLTSPGPALYAQPRLGRDRRLFVCYKMRTMYVNTPSAATHHTPTTSITRVGRWLRRSKCDELTQLWNVLRGDMSFVGPRPCLPIQAELIEARLRLNVFHVRPGITGLAQVKGIDMSDPQRLADADACYIRGQSFLGDLSLILQTIFGGRSARGF